MINIFVGNVNSRILRQFWDWYLRQRLYFWEHIFGLAWQAVKLLYYHMLITILIHFV